MRLFFSVLASGYQSTPSLSQDSSFCMATVKFVSSPESQLWMLVHPIVLARAIFVCSYVPYVVP